MRRISNVKTIYDTVFKGEGFEFRIGLRMSPLTWKHHSDNFSETQINKDGYLYTLTLKTTDKCYYYDLKREKIEDVVEQPEQERVEVMNIINEESMFTMSIGDFYNTEYDKAVHFETEEEMGVGFVKGDKFILPIKEDRGLVAYNMYPYETIKSIDEISIVEKELEGCICYLGMSESDLSGNVIKIKNSKNSTDEYDKKLLWKLATETTSDYTKTFIMHDLDDKILLITKVKVNDFVMFTKRKVDEIPSYAKIIKERYISKKKTRGVTDTIVDPFSWLKY